MKDYQEYLEAATQMAKEAGIIQLELFRTSNLAMNTKLNDFDVVTAADKKSEKHIIDTIHRLFPDHGIIAEESGEEASEKEWRWVIDPLDGTTNYSQGLPAFCVSIALEHDGEPVVGVVYAPYLNELFRAVKGMGAFLNGTPIRVSDKHELSKCVLATGMPYDRATNPDNNLREITEMVLKVRGVRRLGAAALDLCYVAAGFFDGYWELNLQRWDAAAGRLIVEEAGGKVEPIRSDRNISIMAANPRIASKLMAILTPLNQTAE